MKRSIIAIICLVFLSMLCSWSRANAQLRSALKKVQIDSGVTLTFDEPVNIDVKKPLEIIVFALPNGNSTAQTFGKKLKEGDDWHFDIQHIGAQTAFIRKTDQSKNYIVVYAENTLKSWPAWRRKFTNGDFRIAGFIDQIRERYKTFDPKVTLACHSGGGSFVFGFLNANIAIPDYINRIGFLDATYGYETELHLNKLTTWLKDRSNHLEIIAYNDSVVVYNGKPIVSPTGGTWYRSQLMAADLKLKLVELPDRMMFSNHKNVDAILIKNPEAKIFHTVLVEKNGFIQLLFSGTKFEEKGYQFWSDRAYSEFISD